MRYNQLLPVKDNIPIKDQFDFLPFSINTPSKMSKMLWNEAYLNDGEIDERKGYGIRDEDGVAKMSEFHAGLAENIINYWSVSGSIVVDPFAGRVTRAVVTSKLDRHYYGYEVSPTTISRSINHYNVVNIQPTLYYGSGILMNETLSNTVDLVFTCPPYFNIERYESCKDQLSDIKRYDEFIATIGTCIFNCYRVLKPGGFCVFVVADFRKNCELISFHSDIIRLALDVGFKNHDTIIVKNISPFASLQLEKVAAKRYTSKIHEYVLVFRKKIL